MSPPLIVTLPTASAVALTTATPANIITLPLPSGAAAGAWLVWGRINLTLAGATVTALAASLSLTSGALSAQPGGLVTPGRLFPEPISQQLRSLTTVTGTDSINILPTVITILPTIAVPAPSVTLYLVGQATFSAGSVSGYGSLFALSLT